MRKISVIALLLLFCGVYAMAQEPPRGEVFVGYTYLHADTGNSGVDSSWPGGFDIDGTYYLFHNIGLVGDFGYTTKGFSDGTDAHLYSFHFGPRVKMRSGKIEPFAHALFGVTHGSVSPGGGATVSDNAFSMKLGGGIDLSASKHFGVRLGEFNYYLTKFGLNSNFGGNFGSDHQNNFTFSAGILIR